MKLSFNPYDETILYENDIRNIEDIILINAINSYFSRKYYKRLLGYLSKKVGYGNDRIGFTFWDDFDDYDKTQYKGEPFDGLEVEFVGDIKIFDLQDVFYFMMLASQRYIALHPDDQEEIEGFLSNMKNSFDLE